MIRQNYKFMFSKLRLELILNSDISLGLMFYIKGQSYVQVYIKLIIILINCHRFYALL